MSSDLKEYWESSLYENKLEYFTQFISVEDFEEEGKSFTRKCLIEYFLMIENDEKLKKKFNKIMERKVKREKRLKAKLKKVFQRRLSKEERSRVVEFEKEMKFIQEEVKRLLKEGEKSEQRNLSISKSKSLPSMMYKNLKVEIPEKKRVEVFLDEDIEIDDDDVEFRDGDEEKLPEIPFEKLSTSYLSNFSNYSEESGASSPTYSSFDRSSLGNSYSSTPLIFPSSFPDNEKFVK